MGAADMGEIPSELEPWQAREDPIQESDGVCPERSGLALSQTLNWWAMLGSNQRPLRCERSALPLS